MTNRIYLRARTAVRAKKKRPLLEVDLTDGHVTRLRVWPCAGLMLVYALAIIAVAGLVASGVLAWSDVVAVVKPSRY